MCVAKTAVDAFLTSGLIGMTSGLIGNALLVAGARADMCLAGNSVDELLCEAFLEIFPRFSEAARMAGSADVG